MPPAKEFGDGFRALLRYLSPNEAEYRGEQANIRYLPMSTYLIYSDASFKQQVDAIAFYKFVDSSFPADPAMSCPHALIF